MLLGLRARELRRITTGRAPQRRESLDEAQQGVRPRDARASTNHSRVSHWRELLQHELPRSSARFLDPARGRSTDRADSVTRSAASKVASRHQVFMCFGDLGAFCVGGCFGATFQFCFENAKLKTNEAPSFECLLTKKSQMFLFWVLFCPHREPDLCLHI